MILHILVDTKPFFAAKKYFMFYSCESTYVFKYIKLTDILNFDNFEKVFAVKIFIEKDPLQKFQIFNNCKERIN